MSMKWILLANRSGARVYHCKGRGNGLALVQEIDHPEGRLRNKDIDADKSGRRGAGTGTTEREGQPTEQFEQKFANHLADILENGRNSKQYEELILVAEPHFLGTLRNAMKSQTAAMVSESHTKDLMNHATKDIEAHVKKILFP